MEFQDKSLSCADCGQAFVFTAGEQQFYERKGFKEIPKRCKPCREARKARRGDGAAAGGGNGYGNYGRDLGEVDGNRADYGVNGGRADARGARGGGSRELH